MPLDSDGCLVDQTPNSAHSADIDSHAPPLYGQHVLDQLYAGMDQPGLMTPNPQSGMNSPFYSNSRTGSSENLASLNNLTSDSPSQDGAGLGLVTPAALSRRLQQLDTIQNRTLNTGESPSITPLWEHGASGSPRPAHSSNVLSRRTSEEEEHNSGFSNLTSGQHTPEHIDYSDLGDLSKVPSYSTAVRAPIPSTTSPAVLPGYEAAVSGHASPTVMSSSPRSPGITSNPTTYGQRRQPTRPHVIDMDETRRIHLLQRRDGTY